MRHIAKLVLIFRIFFAHKICYCICYINRIRSFMKKVLISFFAFSLLSISTVSAEIKAGSFSISPSIKYSTTKVGEWTGAIYNRTQGGYMGEIRIDHDSGLYGYSNYENDKFFPSDTSLGTYSYIWCSALGYKNKINAFSYDVAFENCYADYTTDENSGLYIVRLGYDVNKDVSLAFNYANQDTGAAKSGTTRYLEDAYNVSASYNLGPVVAKYTYGESDNFTSFHTVGLNKDLLGVNFDLSYWSTDGKSWLSQSFYDRDLLILTAKKTF